MYEKENTSAFIVFENNFERDAYAKKLMDWISNELFCEKNEVQIGHLCYVSDNQFVWAKRKYAGKLRYEEDYPHCAYTRDNELERFRYVKPITCDMTINGDIYTWETIDDKSILLISPNTK